MKNVVINACFGGFSLSPKAVLWLYERGVGDITPIDKYFTSDDDSRHGKRGALKEWREYLATKPPMRESLFLTVFSPDEQFVLGTRDIERDNPLLIQCVKEMGAAANGGCANLRIVDLPDDADWEISEYDGREHVAERHRTWS